MSDLALPEAAFLPDADGQLHATALTRGPWDPGHQHAGPPSAMIARAVEAAALPHGLTLLGRLTVNLIRPIPIGSMRIEVEPHYIGRSAGHFGALLACEGRVCARATALVLRELPVPVPPGTAGHPLPLPPTAWTDAVPVTMPFAQRIGIGYPTLIENRSADGRIFDGPCTAWFRLRHPLVRGEVPSPAQRVLVAADSGNGVSAVLDAGRYTFVNSDLTVHLLRQPRGEWICLDARTSLGGNGCGLAESTLYDAEGPIGNATQSLVVRERT